MHILAFEILQFLKDPFPEIKSLKLQAVISTWSNLYRSVDPSSEKLTEVKSSGSWFELVRIPWKLCKDLNCVIIVIWFRRSTNQVRFGLFETSDMIITWHNFGSRGPQIVTWWSDVDIWHGIYCVLSCCAHVNIQVYNLE